MRRITRPPPERFEAFVAAEEELGAGDYFGTSAILGSGERKRHSTMIAVTDVHCVRLGRDDFEAGQAAFGDGRSVSDPAASGAAAEGGERALSDPLAAPPSPPRLAAAAQQQHCDPTAAAVAAQHRDPSHTPASSLLPPRRITANAMSRSARRSLRFLSMMSNHEQRRYGRGDTLFREGEDARQMFIITEGKVQVACEGPDGRRHTIGTRGAGECCGETSCLSAKPRNSTVTCVSDEGCEVMCVSREDFLALVRGSWHVAQDLVAVSDRHQKEKERRVNFRRTREEVGGEDDDDDDYYDDSALG